MAALDRIIDFLEDVWVEAIAPFFRRKNPADAYRRAVLMTANEAEFHTRLRYAFPAPNWEIWPQVAMLALVETREKPGGAAGWSSFNAIQARRVDWVLARDSKPLAIIELDDRTHDRNADNVRDAILAAGRWPVIRFDSRNKPPPQEIARQVLARLNSGSGAR